MRRRSQREKRARVYETAGAPTSFQFFDNRAAATRGVDLVGPTGKINSAARRRVFRGAHDDDGQG
jgi:hypothetical protein